MQPYSNLVAGPDHISMLHLNRLEILLGVWRQLHPLSAFRPSRPCRTYAAGMSQLLTSFLTRRSLNGARVEYLI